MPAFVLLAVFGVWIVTQATGGRLAARVLSYRAAAPTDARSVIPGGVPIPGRVPADPIVPTTPTAAGWVWPVHGPVTQIFGQRNSRDANGHPGLDISATTGTPVVAARPGTVSYASWNDGYGNWVAVEHGGGYQTGYAHLSRIGVTVGQNVAQGETLGAVGSTGQSTGPHLHLEVRHGGTLMDPVAVIGGTP